MLLRVLFFVICSFSLTTISAQTFQSVESVEYDANNNRWLASNGSSIIARASNGTLSFFGNARASHGMEVIGDTLYAIANNSIKAYSLTTAEELMSLSIPGVSFLNGMTNDGTNIYVTDFGDDAIYKVDISDLDNPIWERIVANTQSTPNGILYDAENNRLLFVNWGSSAAIKAVDLTDNSVSTIIDNTGLGNIDGIDDDAAGNYYISSWSPNRITKYDSNFENPETISTPSISSPADIGYAMATDTLAIPVGNNVVFVGFDPITSTHSVEKATLFEVYPNPVDTYTTIHFDLQQSETVSIELYTINGQFIKQFQNEPMIAGKHHVVLTDLNLVKGSYICTLKIGNRLESVVLHKK